MNSDNSEKLQADPFVSAYVAAMFWADIEDEFSQAVGVELDADDLAQEAVDRIISDCRTFQKDQADWLSNAYQKDGYGPEQAGHDFWLTRCGHGAGFWDRGLGETGEVLTETVGHGTAYPDLTPYLGDDGHIYFG